MKKIVLIAALALISAAAIGQTKADTAKSKVQYRYYVTLPADDYKQLVNGVHGYRDGSTYNPTMTGDEKARVQAGVDAFLFGLPRRVKVDSIPIDIGTINRQKVRAHIDSLAAKAKVKS